jgi:hypothetical protein
MKKHWIGILIVGLTMGTAWAIRGQFGHEPGAAWAGGIGALALILVSGRTDWYNKAILITLSSALGWGAGGIISYGIVVGYGRSTDFLNAAYGLEMLFVIGGLFGLLGGGLLGLTLESSDEKKVKWASLLTEMIAGGILVHSFLIDQLDFLMTPPRSEAWAICLGAGLAMLWYMARNRYDSSLRLALFSTLGAGFGFAFGNFLQIVGNVLEINFNMWNVMEYSIGFFGGVSMAYGVFNSKWPVVSSVPKPWENKIAAALLFIFVPFLVFQGSAFYDILFKNMENAQTLTKVTYVGSNIALATLIFQVIFSWYNLMKNEFVLGRQVVLRLFLCYLSVYIIFSYIVTGAFSGIFMSNHLLYVVNFIVILFFMYKYLSPIPIGHQYSDLRTVNWPLYFASIVSVILFLAFISIHLHGELKGVQSRF